MMASPSQWFTICDILLEIEIRLSKYPVRLDCSGPPIEEAINRIIVLVC
jgi:hypothetical protein